MHIHLPKPLHGWREFAGEVGIIVIGVLIALAAEQVVETLHWRHEVSLFRNSVDHEIANNLGTYVYRMRENACVDARLQELDRLLASWRAGHPLTLDGTHRSTLVAEPRKQRLAKQGREYRHAHADAGTAGDRKNVRRVRQQRRAPA